MLLGFAKNIFTNNIHALVVLVQTKQNTSNLLERVKRLRLKAYKVRDSYYHKMVQEALENAICRSHGGDVSELHFSTVDDSDGFST